MPGLRPIDVCSDLNFLLGDVVVDDDGVFRDLLDEEEHGEVFNG